MTEPRLAPDRQRRALGWGLRCDPILPGADIGRDLSWRGGPHGRDLDIVEGVDCLTQDLAVALTTLRGSDVLNPAFGFDGLAAIAEERLPVMVQERLRVAVVTLLLRDPRVRRIVDVKWPVDPDQPGATGEGGRAGDTGAQHGDQPLEPPPAGHRTLNVTVTFETITDTTVTVDLGRLTFDA